MGKAKDAGKVKAPCPRCDDTGKVPDFRTNAMFPTMVTCKCKKEQDDGR